MLVRFTVVEPLKDRTIRELKIWLGIVPLITVLMGFQLLTASKFDGNDVETGLVVTCLLRSAQFMLRFKAVRTILREWLDKYDNA